jgi:Flp pilus assembly pilin Flp
LKGVNEMRAVTELICDDKGQGMAEYALLLVLIAVAAIGIARLLGGSIIARLAEAADEIQSAEGIF